MACKYLSDFRIPGCLASQTLMYPSIYELNTLCHSNYQKCLIYQRKEATVHLRNDQEKEETKFRKKELSA